MPGLRLDDFLPYRLSVAANRVSERIAGAYRARFGLKIPEWRVLAVLAEEAETTQARLVARTAMDRMTISRAVAALRTRGLIVLGPAADRRTRRLSLSAEGQRLYAEVVPAALALEAEVLAGLTAAERAQLMALLARLGGCPES
ncbi:MAG: MarR family winged helix-turn-helix transcriptional regulator [Sphingomonadaceae bacterium]|nr:MarR family winged helix-turn-helix transcriptional regulator [Sphingomonadaceae bacterium]MDW8414748.1 MarR family winged helix-turn-helix transcriptional regulator [Thermaurantiacus sp.]